MSRNYTPHKSPKTRHLNTCTHTYYPNTPQPQPQPHLPNSDHPILKDYQQFKYKSRYPENKNYSLTTQVEQLLEQKKYQDNKYAQKLSFDQQTISEIYKGKNYQIEMVRIKQEEDLSRIRRQYQLRTDQLLRELKHKDYQIKQKDQQNLFMQLKNEELAKQIESLALQLQKYRQQNSQNTQQITHNEFKIKKLQMFIQQLQLHKTQMQQQIRTLLDIEAQKTITLNTLEIQLQNSQDNQKKMTDKLQALTEHFAELENHINIMKQKLINAQENNYLINQKLEKTQLTIHEQQKSLHSLKQIQNQILLQFDDCQRKLNQRQRQIIELITENQRLYKQLNITRHRLHQFSAVHHLQI